MLRIIGILLLITSTASASPGYFRLHDGISLHHTQVTVSKQGRLTVVEDLTLKVNHQPFILNELRRFTRGDVEQVTVTLNNKALILRPDYWWGDEVVALREPLTLKPGTHQLQIKYQLDDYVDKKAFEHSLNWPVIQPGVANLIQKATYQLILPDYNHFTSIDGYAGDIKNADRDYRIVKHKDNGLACETTKFIERNEQFVIKTKWRSMN